MLNKPAVSTRELELESGALLPSRETLCVTRFHHGFRYGHDRGYDRGCGDDRGSYGYGGDRGYAYGGDGGYSYGYGDGGDCGGDYDFSSSFDFGGCN
jgi:hypothetical protein